ncbi:Putative 115 kDa protein in type-1 retrotransposable element R1DM [Eumeta japonica]|uniref:115 kDa protein in type-1 retrotransposable element R1DM n=1 Tax=Eumeta variegata TaxID=151549 RepID=A0A4C1YV87_EUMVA|nr:Putative 115 kDa protein in type-1 retrotransposable element R1DM [Eumeta japonica]
MFSGQSASSIEEEANRALARVHCWGVRNKLRFAPSKTNSMVLTKKLKYDDPVVHMNGERISSVGEIRLLGLTIDKKLTFIPHVAKACKKATNIYKGLARAAKATWGLSPEIVRTIYITVIEPIVLYASCAWAPATRKLGVRKMLDAVQRSVALKACRAHRTVSLHSALILARLLPLDIRVREVAWLYEVKRGKDLGDTFCRPGARETRVFRRFASPRARARNRVRERRGPRPPRRWTVSPSSGRAFSPTVAVSKAKSERP